MLTLLLTLLPSLTVPLLHQGPLPVDAGGEARADDRFEDLQAEYKRVALDWRRAQRAAKKEKRSFDDRHPIHEYFPRFQALADAGEGRALQWVGLNAEDTEGTPGEVKKIKRAAFERLVREFAHESYVLDLVKKASKQEDWLEDEEICAYLAAIHERNPKKSTAALAGYNLALRYSARGTDEDAAKAEAIYERLVTDYADTKTAKRAQKKLDARNYQIGKIPPDFEAEDVDGNAFKLSDYKGKVVVLDFWGFW